MKSSPTIAPLPAQLMPQRQVWLLSALFFVLWLTQIRYPPLSYPHIGLLLLTLAAALGAILPYQVWKAAIASGVGTISHPTLLPGFSFVIWSLTRWALAGFPASGAAPIGTLLWTAVYLVIALSLALLSQAKERRRAEGSPPLGLILLFLLSLAGLVCGLHAVWQYHFAYAEAYRELSAAIGDRAPDRTEMGLLHHLQLRRVASIWGDPNALAIFSAMAVCASLELLNFSGRGKAAIRLAAIASIGASLAAVYYSGSRGGVIDVAAVLVLFGGYLLLSRRFSGRARISGLAIVTAIFTFARIGDASAQEADTLPVVEDSATSTRIEAGWVWRSNTIRERIYYLQVGARMVQVAPVVGLGPGSVELYFGRMKPPEARETRHLHNWVMQTTAETGAIGIILLGWFLGALTWQMWRVRLWRQPVNRALVVLFLLFLFDGLIQISWNHRELMVTFGAICGLLIAETGHLMGTGEASSRWRSSIWLGATMALAGVLALLDSRHLAAKSNKQMASDAAFAGDLAAAEKYWARATAWAPGDAEPLTARASLAMDRGQLTPARGLVEKALAAEPSSAATHALAAEIYARLHDLDRADAHLTNALELYPSHPEYNWFYAKHLQARGDLSRALPFAIVALRNNYKAEDQEKYASLVSELQAALKGQEGSDNE